MLLKIQEMVQRCANMITAVLQIDVDIADNNFIRIAATGRFNEKIGKHLSMEGHAMRHVLQHGHHVYIQDPSTNAICNNCPNIANCIGQQEISYPIVLGERVFGVMTIASSNEIQRKRIETQHEQLLLFLQSVSELIALRVLDQEATEQQEYNLMMQEKLTDLISECVMILSSDNKVIFINKRCEMTLGVTLQQIRYLEKINRFSIRRRYVHMDNETEYSVQIGNRQYSLTGKVHRVFDKRGETYNKILIFTKKAAILSPDALNKESKDITFESIIGTSDVIMQTIEQCKQHAYQHDCILLYGERGVGKTVFAKAIHSIGNHRGTPLVEVASEKYRSPQEADYQDVFTLMQDEERYKNQTVFIREVAALSPKEQEKLLLLIRNREKTNTCILCSTDKDLKKLVSEGTFQDELYYILGICQVRIPPIRSRDQDILLYIDYYLQMFNDEFGKSVGFSREVYQAFLKYSWPGNIWEVKNVISYIVAGLPFDSGNAAWADLPANITEKVENEKQPEYNLEIVEYNTILAALNNLKKKGVSKQDIAKALGISNATLYRKLIKYNISESQFFK